jgi:hypothetical protein
VSQKAQRRCLDALHGAQGVNAAVVADVAVDAVEETA